SVCAEAMVLLAPNSNAEKSSINISQVKTRMVSARGGLCQAAGEAGRAWRAGDIDDVQFAGSRMAQNVRIDTKHPAQSGLGQHFFRRAGGGNAAVLQHIDAIAIA